MSVVALKPNPHPLKLFLSLIRGILVRGLYHHSFYFEICVILNIIEIYQHKYQDIKWMMINNRIPETGLRPRIIFLHARRFSLWQVNDEDKQQRRLWLFLSACWKCLFPSLSESYVLIEFDL